MRSTTPPAAVGHAPATRETHSEADEDQFAAAALESTRLAIARWTGGIHLPQMLVPGMIRVSPQARWYAQANSGFQEWLKQGGFAQGADSATGAARPPSRLRLDIDNENAGACID